MIIPTLHLTSSVLVVQCSKIYMFLAQMSWLYGAYTLIFLSLSHSHESLVVCLSQFCSFVKFVLDL